MQELAISEHMSKGTACNLDELGCGICCNSVPMTVPLSITSEINFWDQR